VGIVSRLVRREGPVYRRLRKPEGRRLKIWVAPQTLEKYESNWEMRLRNEVFGGLGVKYLQSPYPVWTLEDAHGGVEVWAKCLPGWETVVMGDGTRRPVAGINVGDKVIGAHGFPIRVTGVHETGLRQVFRLELDDHTTLAVTPEHRLWDGTRNVPAAQATRVATSPARQYAITPDASPLPIPPYLLGALIGDGSLRADGVVFTSADAPVIERTDRELRWIGYRFTKTRRYGYVAVEDRLTPKRGRRPAGALIQALAALKLLGTVSATKFIPPAYLQASEHDRLNLLAGLIDTDGDDRSYSSISAQLSSDVAHLIRSLGGYARMDRRVTTCSNSKTHAQCVSWKVGYRLDGLPLALARKQQRHKPQRPTVERKVIKTTDIGLHRCYDLTVDSPSHLYLAGEAEVLVHNSQDQGFLAFESDVVDLVVFDEEPADRRVVTSAQRGFSTTNGVLVLAFTPLMGVSWTHGAYYVPTVKDEYRVADRVWRRGDAITVVQMGMADNPASVAGGGVRRIQENVGMPESEKRTRLFGEYGYSEGLIFPEFAGLTREAESPYLLETLPEGRAYSWLLTCDPNKRHGGLLVAIDHEQNWIVVAEHYAEDLPDRLHAEAYKRMWSGLKLAPDQVAVYADPGGAGAQAIVNLRDCGVFAAPVPKDAGSVKASIELIRRMAYLDPGLQHITSGAQGAPRLYFLRSLRSRWTEGGVAYDESRLLWELRQYRQKTKAAPDTPIKQRDDVVDPLRYVGLVRPWGPGEPVSRRETSEEAETSRRWDERIKKLGAHTQEPNRPWKPQRMVPA
jgi:phage terminase large subunit-like protein